MLLHTDHQRIQARYLQGAIACIVAMLAVAALPLLRPVSAPPGTAAKSDTIAGSAPGAANAAKSLPLSFEPNAGQADPSASFIAHASGGTLFFGPTNVTLALSKSIGRSASQSGTIEPNPGRQNLQGDSDAQPQLVHLSFVGSNEAVNMAGRSQLPGRVNYLIGNNPANWHSNLPTFGSVVYSGLYAGIDLSYVGTQARLKGTYTVAAGADPLQIRWQYGGSAVSVDSGGNLQIAIGGSAAGAGGEGNTGSITEQAPVAWQEIAGSKAPVAVRYYLHDDGTIGFWLGSYDKTEPLIIDPTLVYSTYLGGFYRDVAYSVALDAQRNMYITGETASTDFPLAGDPLQPGFGGGDTDIFVSKLSADGSMLLYSTFLGGDGHDYGRFISVDGAGDAIVGGGSTSANFPTTPGAYQQQFVPNEDVVVSKLNATGSGLIFSTYWGGGVLSTDAFAIDATGNVYFTGYVQLSLFNDVFAGAVTADGAHEVFHAYLGGQVRGPGDTDANSGGQGIAVNSSGDVFVTGFTRAADFPVTAGAYSTHLEAYEDGFVARYKASDHSLVYSTFIPGNVSEYPYDIAADSDGNAYITGFTDSSDYPTTPGVFQRTKFDVMTAFVTKLNPAGSALVYSTYLGGQVLSITADTRGEALQASKTGDVYIVGFTGSSSFPTVNPLQANLLGDSDAFVTKLSPDASSIEFSTYLGGDSDDFAEGLALDSSDIYLVGGTLSTDFPSAQPFQAHNGGDADAFVVRISEAAVTPTPTPTGTAPTATPTSCVPGIAPWHTEPPISIRRDYASAAAAGGKLYVLGGENTDLEPPYIAQVERFNPSLGTWDLAAPMPVAASKMAVATLGSKIYLAGGFTARQGFTLDLMQIYDSATDSWSQGAHLPVHVNSAAAAAYNGKIYIFGGVDQSDSNLVFEYDPVADTYTPKAPMPIAQAGMGAASVGDRIYIVGGYNYLHFAYDPATDTWSTIAPSPTPNYFAFAGVFALDGEVWVEGGYDQQNFRGFPPQQAVQIYNPTNNSWRFGPAFNIPRMRSSAAAALNGRAYVAGGVALNNEHQFLTDVESTGPQSCSTPVSGTATSTSTSVPATSPTASATTGTPHTTSTVGATSTPTATVSASATATPCGINFTDVQASDYFDEAVSYLYCQGVISGYADNTFRPYNNTTRGQMTKIVVLGFGLPILVPSGTPRFSDVAPGSAFYEYVETAAHNNIVSGYADGTFRPANNVTRGELSKIVVAGATVAEGWSLLNPAVATFSDVPPNSPFYTYIETAYCHRILSGYADHTFRPAAYATRGQISKIQYLAVLDQGDCTDTATTAQKR